MTSELRGPNGLRYEFRLSSVKRTIKGCLWDYGVRHYPFKTLNGIKCHSFKALGMIRSCPSKALRLLKEGRPQDNLVLSWLKSSLTNFESWFREAPGQLGVVPILNPFGSTLGVGPRVGCKLN